VDDRALLERLRFPRFQHESGEMLGFAHIPTGTRNQPFLKIGFEGRGGEAAPSLDLLQSCAMAAAGTKNRPFAPNKERLISSTSHSRKIMQNVI